MKLLDKEKLSDILNVEYSEVIVSESKAEDVSSIESSDSDNELEYDLNLVRNNYHDILDSGNLVLEKAQEIAEQSEHPRAIEVYSGLLKNLSEINMQLLDMHKKRKEIKEPKKEESVQQVTNNTAVFVGTMSELTKKIKDGG